MKKTVTRIISLTILGGLCLMASCSGDEFDEVVVEEVPTGRHWERANTNLHVNRIDFDTQIGMTRSVDEGWKDGDRIYLILKDKDENNVQAYVEYDTVTTSWGQVEYDGYKSYLTCTTPRAVEAYFFDGDLSITASDISFEATTGIYVCKEGVYTYPPNGDLEITISLAPLTSRIRFTGKSGDNLTLASGVKTFTTFSRTTGLLTQSTSSITTLVDTTGSTPYIYGVFANQEEPTIEIVNNGVRFKTIFEPSTEVLQIGVSGYMPIPTIESHRGWKQIFIHATSISLDKNSLDLRIGEVATLNATLTPADATSKIVWSSSDTSVAEVSDTGVVTAIAGGNAIITATASDNPNIKATCSVVVPRIETYPSWTSTNKVHSTTSSKTYTITASAGSVLTFDWLVSSESRWDKLIVTIGSTEILNKSGELSGTCRHTFTYSGTYTMVVKYTKDGSYSSGSDYAKVYNIVLNP